MSKMRITGIVLVVVGAILLWQGWQARQSFSSQLSQALQGTPTDQAMWMMIAGAAVAIVGLIVLVRR